MQPTRLLLLGGGHAHAVVLLKFRNFISEHLEVTLVSSGAAHVYSGMVPGVVAGHYAAADAQIDLAGLARGAGAGFVQGRVARFDADAKTVELDGGQQLDYDLVSLNLGSVPEGSRPPAIPVKPFEPFLARWRALLESGPSAPRIAVAGAGAGGVEVAMAMQHALNRRGAGGTVVLFSEKNEFSSGLAARLRHALAALAIELRPATPAAPDESGFDAVFWLAGAAAPPLLRECGVKTDARGFALVDACLRSVSHPDVFAAGDTASMLDTPVPKSGVYAVRQGAVLADNLGRALRGMPMLDYVPQKASLSLISCGWKYAIASRGGWSAEGAWAWHWKDWLDRRWIARFR